MIKVKLKEIKTKYKNQKQIIKKVIFYKNKTEIEAIKKYLDSLKECKELNDCESNSCEGEITVDECTDAILKWNLKSVRV